MLHLHTLKTSDLHKYPAYKKSTDQHSNQQGKNISGCYNNVVTNAKNFKNSFSSCKSVNNHLYTSRQYHQEPPPDQCMHHSNHRAAKYLCLQESYFQCENYPPANISDRKSRFGKFKKIK